MEDIKILSNGNGTYCVVIKDIDGIERECNVSREALENFISDARMALDEEDEEEE